MADIEVPYDWSPRDYQMPAWQALEGGCKRVCLVWHRRAGKDAVGLNWTIRSAITRVGMYWHILPTYKQARKVIWDGMTGTGRRYLDHWPGNDLVEKSGRGPGLVRRRRDDEMTLWLDNGSIWQCVGCETKEDVDKLVGTNPVGVVFSEYSLHLPGAWDLIRPILAENGGWALFAYTPRGRNHGYRLYQQAEKNPDWFAQVLTVDDTKSVPQKAIDDDRESGMPPELIQQEYYCSWNAPLVGAYYGDLMQNAADSGRITKVPWEPKLPVETWWDLGYGDATAIWWMQRSRGGEVRAIDYYQSVGKSLQHYLSLMHDGHRQDWVYAKHLVPHDAEAHELGTGQTIVETARDLGFRFTSVAKLGVADGIQACRNIIPQTWFDEERCDTGIQALQEYTKEQIAGVYGPNGEPMYRDTPAHNWASHGADAFRTGAVGSRPPRKKPERLAPKLALV